MSMDRSRRNDIMWVANGGVFCWKFLHILGRVGDDFHGIAVGC
jgi:hypothetical protein